MKTLVQPKNFSEWRKLSRSLLASKIPPDQLLWEPKDQTGLFHDDPPESVCDRSFSIPKSFINLAETASCHRSDDQWALLYSVLWRIIHGERHLLSMATDPEIHRLRAMARHISRDIHKMHAFVRFRKIAEDNGREQFIAWFEPDHLIIRLAAPFFRKRFSSMDWSILTPDECVHWDGQKIHFTEGVDKSRAVESDSFDELWKTYYRSIFNPARLKVRAMQSEMPKKYWKNLPEAEVIQELISSGSETTERMLAKPCSPEKPAPDNDYLKMLWSLE